MGRPKQDPLWRRRVVVASDRPGWARRAAWACVEIDAEPELVDWARARSIREPLGAILADASAPPERTGDAFRAWARHAWQACTVVWLPPIHGAAELHGWLDALGYEITRPSEATTPVDEAWKGSLEDRLERDAWLVSRFARGLDAVDDPRLLRILAIPIVQRNPPATVTAWRRKAGVYDKREFARLLSGGGRPSPKRILDRLRLAAGLLRIRYSRAGVRRAWAARAGYGSGDSLGRRVKELTGHTALKLAELPLLESVELLVGGHVDLET